MRQTFDPAKHCGALGRQRGEPCLMTKGARTVHPGSGRCWLHGGSTRNGRKFGAREAVEQAIAKLGLPRGTGDPIALLTDAVRHSQGLLEATAKIVAEHATAEGTADLEKARFSLTAAMAAYENAIRQAAVTGSVTVNAKVAEQMVAVEERKIELLQLALQRALDRMEPDPAWRDRFLVTLGEELVAISAPPAALTATN